jgi:hypothetical protein
MKEADERPQGTEKERNRLKSTQLRSGRAGI